MSSPTIDSALKVQSFEIASKKKTKGVRVSENAHEQQQDTREFIKSISADGTIQSIDGAAKPTGPLVIPLALQQTFRSRKSAPTIANQEPENELDKEAREMILRQANNQVQESDMEIEAIPLLLQNQVPGLMDIKDEKGRLEHDINSRPEDVTQDAYDQVPVEKFGQAMLRGMGWEPGKAVGLNAKTVVEPIEFIPRDHRAGLGAKTMKDIDVKDAKRGRGGRKWIPKPGETNEPQARMRLPVGPDGKIRHVRKLDEELIVAAPTQLDSGVLVEIIDGSHKDMEARVISVLDQKNCRVKLTRSGQEVDVEAEFLKIVDEAMRNYQKKHKLKYGLVPAGEIQNSKPADEDDNTTKQSSKSKDSSSKRKHSNNDKDKEHEKDKDKHSKRSKHSKSEDEDEDLPPCVAGWLCPRIRVRVLSKRAMRGRAYMKKAVVVDVPVPGVANLDVEGECCEGLKERDLQTALPKAGGQILVVYGEHKGKLGTLLERDSKSNKGVVQLAEELCPVVCVLDHIAEFVDL